MRPTLRFLALAFGGLFLLGLAVEARARAPLLLGAGDQTYRWVPGWAKLPDGMTLGSTHGCIAIDQADNVYVCTDTENAVVVFDRAGNFLRAFGKELAGGLHGMQLRKEGSEEFLYLAHLARHQVLKTTLAGEILWTLGYPAESGLYEDPAQFLPTSVAVAPNGDLYVADGYGLSWIHVFDAERHYKRSFGGLGALRGQFNTCHGLSVVEWKGAQVLVVADRENHRLQVLDLEGRVLAVTPGELRRPCDVEELGGALLVPDLAGRVTVLGAGGEVLAQLGEQPDPSLWARNDVGREHWKDGEFLSPHCARWDSHGDLYVVDWSLLGRISKLERVR